MRQWMCDPRFMCNKHLFGEHVEHHMFIGTLERKKSINGYIRNDLLLLLSRCDVCQQRYNYFYYQALERGEL